MSNRTLLGHLKQALLVLLLLSALVKHIHEVLAMDWTSIHRKKPTTTRCIIGRWWWRSIIEMQLIICLFDTSCIEYWPMVENRWRSALYSVVDNHSLNLNEKLHTAPSFSIDIVSICQHCDDDVYIVRHWLEKVKQTDASKQPEKVIYQAVLRILIVTETARVIAL